MDQAHRSDIRAGGKCPADPVRPQDTGSPRRSAIASLPVRRRVRLGLFFTGDELVMPGDPLPPGRIYNSNRFTLNGLRASSGARPATTGASRFAAATRKCCAAPSAECDVIVNEAAASRSARRTRQPAVEAEGELLMWKIAMSLGGRLRSGGGQGEFHRTAGNPVSSFVTFSYSSGRFSSGPKGSPTVQPHTIPCAPISTGPNRSPARVSARKMNARGGLDLYPTRTPRC